MASDFASQLKQIKLKKAGEPIRDYSDPKTAGYTTTEEIRDYEDKVLAVNTENWLDVLQDVTFPTVLSPFTLDDANLFLEVYSRLYLNKDSSDACDCNWQKRITEDESLKIHVLKERLDSALSIFTDDGYAFVKLSSRSAKDAPLIQRRFEGLYKGKLSVYSETEQADENVQLTCLLQAGFDALRVKTAADVIDMFIRSERVYQDLLLAAVNQKDRFNENFIIRKFVDIDVDMEFRGFVYDWKLTALSQYNYLVYSKRLAEHYTEISDKIKNFYDTFVKQKLKVNKDFPSNFIVDFAVCQDGDKDKLWVIEINPFLNTTDGAMFSWEKERDILEGKHGFQFRYVQKPKPGSLSMMPQSIRNLLRSALK